MEARRNKDTVLLDYWTNATITVGTLHALSEDAVRTRWGRNEDVLRTMCEWSEDAVATTS